MRMPAGFAMGLCLLASAAIAQAPTPPTSTAPAAMADAPRPATVKVNLVTSMGPILLELEKERAPITTANFLRYVDQKRFDGVNFYRAVNIAPGFGLIQGGVRGDPKRVLKPIEHEPTSKTGLHHGDGTISMARATPGTASGDFFITMGDMPTMDADPKQPGDNAGFAAFGHVIGGMDVVRHIMESPTSPTAGEPDMKGQMLAPVVQILSARRAD